MAHRPATPGSVRGRCHLAGVCLTALLVCAGAPDAFAAKIPVTTSPQGAPTSATLPAGQAAPRSPQSPPPAPDKNGWTTIFSDDFEGSFPGPWQLLNQGVNTGWGRWSCWSGDTPTRSVGSAAGGASPIACGQNYPNDMRSWIYYGPFSLNDPSYTDAELRFNFRLDSEVDYDFLRILASVNGTNFFGYQISGTHAPQAGSLDLTNVPDLGNLLGQPQVWIAFYFTSDESVTAANGAQVDDVVIRAFSPSANQAPTVTVTSPGGGETWTAGSQRTITYTANDPDGGPNPLAIAIDFSSNGGGSWQPVTSGQNNTGSFVWTVPQVATSQARIRVRATDGADEGQGVSAANFTITVPQSGDNTLAVGTGSGASGTSVTVALSLANEHAVKGLQADIVYNAGVAQLSGVQATGRGAGMTAASHVVSDGRARVVLYHQGASTVAAGTGAVANLVFDLGGAAGSQTALALDDIILSNPDGGEVVAVGQAGSVAVSAPVGPPVLRIAALKNPGRVRSVQIMIQVTGGSGSLPSVTAGGSAVAMTALGGGRFLGTFAAAGGAASVIITAADTNANGPGNTQLTLEF